MNCLCVIIVIDVALLGLKRCIIAVSVIYLSVISSINLHVCLGLIYINIYLFDKKSV